MEGVNKSKTCHDFYATTKYFHTIYVTLIFAFMLFNLLNISLSFTQFYFNGTIRETK